jgi:hypothetical protein
VIVLSAAQVAGGVAGAVVSLVTLLGLLWRIMTAIVRHIEATHANTHAISTLGAALSEHVTKTSDRLTAVETTTKQHAIILERFPRHA